MYHIRVENVEFHVAVHHFHVEICVIHVMKNHFHDTMPVFHERPSQTPDVKSYQCAWIVQTMQDIAQVWMTTAGLVWCDIPICRKHGAKDATLSLYCRDPHYVQKIGTGAGKGAHQGTILYSGTLSLDWGCDASHVRDDDMKLVVRMIQGLFRGEIVNAPDLSMPSKQSSHWQRLCNSWASRPCPQTLSAFSRVTGGNGARPMISAACWTQVRLRMPG